MASVTGICNLALEKLGGGYIIDITENTKEARSLNRVYDYVRDTALRLHPWNFAMQRALLPALVDAPVWGRAYSFQLPVDCLRVVDVDSLGIRDFDVEGGQILTDAAGPLKIRYIKRITDPNLFDALFIEVLACRLAVEICEDLTQSNSKQQIVEGKLQAAMDSATNVDGQESPPGDMPLDPWLEARF